MAKTLSGIKRIARSHETDHEFCSVDSCEVARELALGFAPEPAEPDEVDELAERALVKLYG